MNRKHPALFKLYSSPLRSTLCLLGLVLGQFAVLIAQQAPGNEAAGPGQVQSLLQQAEAAESPDSIVYYYETALENARKQGNTRSEKDVFHAYAAWHAGSSNLELAREYATKSLNLAWELSDSASVIQDLGLLASIENDLANFQQALRHCNEAVVLSQLRRDTINKRYVHLLIQTGEVFRGYQDWDKALPFFERALAIGRQIDDKKYLAASLSSVATIMQETERYDAALEYLFEGLQITIDAGDMMGQSITTNNIGFTYKQMEKYQEALRYYFDALDLKRTMGHRAGEAYSLNEIGETYSFMGEYDKAVDFSLQALAIAREQNAMYYVRNITNTVAASYAAKGDSASAFRYKEQYHAIQDSMYSRDRFRELGNIESSLRYEKDRAEKEIALVKQERARERLVGVVILLVSLLVLLGGIFFLITLRRRNRQLEKDKARQMEFSAQLISWQEDERKRVARELHDGLGQSLSIIKNKVLSQVSGDAPMAEIADSVGKAIQEVRVISHALRPMQLDVLGLSAALEDLVDDTLSAGNINFVCEVDDIDGLLDKNQEVMTYRLVQESMNNILKHADCTQVQVKVERNRDAVALMIADDGKGFDPDTIRPERLSGMGFKGMRERVAFSQGTMQVDSAVGQGTTIFITIPMSDEK